MALHRQRVKGPQASVEVAACADVAATIDVDNISSATELEDPIPPGPDATREEHLQWRLSKMDAVELRREVAAAKKCKYFGAFIWDTVGVVPEEFPQFGEYDEVEELVAFHLWMEDNYPTSAPSLADAATGKLNTVQAQVATPCRSDATPPVQQADTQVAATQSSVDPPPARDAPEPTLAAPVEPAVPAPVAPNPAPIPAAPVVSSPAAVPAPVAPNPANQGKQMARKAKDEEVTFAPVTAEGMRCFFAAMRRASTQSLDSENGDSQGSSMVEVTEPEPSSRPEPLVRRQHIAETDIPGSEPVSVLVAAPAPDMPPPATVPSPALVTPVPAPAESMPPPATVPSPAPVTPVPAPAESMPPPATVPTPAPAPVLPASMPPPATIPVKKPVATGDASEQDKEDEKKARAEYMRYYRSVRSQKCPPQVKQKFEAALSSPNGKEEIAALFKEFKACGENWWSSTMVMEEARSVSTTARGTWKWMTRDDSW